MKLHLLKAKDLQDTNDNPWEPCYDKMFSVVVSAKSEKRARSLAAEHSGDEGKEAWLDKKYSTCEVLKAKNLKGENIVISDIHNG